MKSYMLLALILFGTMSFAQPPKRSQKMQHQKEKMMDMPAENIATLMSKKMTLQLDLSETQQAKVYELILESTIEKKAQRTNRKKEKPSKEKHFEMQNKMLDDKIAFNKSMKSILNETQYSLWKQHNQMKKKKPKRQ